MKIYNPITGYPIQVGGVTYNRLVTEGIFQIGGDPELLSRKINDQLKDINDEMARFGRAPMKLSELSWTKAGNIGLVETRYRSVNSSYGDIFRYIQGEDSSTGDVHNYGQKNGMKLVGETERQIVYRAQPVEKPFEGFTPEQQYALYIAERAKMLNMSPEQYIQFKKEQQDRKKQQESEQEQQTHRHRRHRRKK
jgi:hypothetical protein